ncbi:uncharacterized protein LOC133283648 isoform X1 [Gastrolobium bilobum]|uniref:uncharacterized protein LOC133283648 isoform X1 n=1 Tax=Gastrolobium bilobum TaxID=150636 RepID=UPI002AB2B32D|nr:uncharacterized protein LOC133283648 isoform X1 [Gastrolobium bilobum]XP_061336519.1 uncharacterized protein LOC133283648 isoform X1 [Gastrolobium bilobum]XP_061336520.1 uncharacterized protein LOC133283648 isoform X1 [Gastrolobium bilobum]XP_061336521.1 uncharacterized protein LOC133283648 isoform X1 [Gastrolobium bilobum]XP_061336522.1 uncharacterized protein LOC133283648 isoform X1 [Gastrolobium bilobum]XP_061336523.1 uncharacterized protein LOC133283648 isoform X1 [Gastrolobium bilobum]
MASRGRGRGRGRGGGANYATQVPFVLFPEDVNLPDVKLDDIDANMKKLLNWNYKFQNYWKASPYLLEETTLKKESQKMHVPRFSDKKRTVFTRDSLSQVLMLNDFPKELIQGTSKRMPSRKKFRWNPELEMKKIDFFEQLEKKDQGQEDKGEKEKKDGENEDEDENAGEEEGEEDFSDDDYNQNEYFDDDEDDYNDADDGDDEGVY